MGQRLNIEIFNNGQVVVNAYYHWSAYTRSALELTAKVISAYNDMPLSSDKKRKSCVGFTGDWRRTTR